VGTSGLIVPALLFLSLPTAKAGVQITRVFHNQSLKPVFRGTLGIGFLAGMAVIAYPFLPVFLERSVGPEPLKIGVEAEPREIVELLKLHTTDRARILWEDVADGRLSQSGRNCWTALLPLLTDRSFIGGLDPEGRIVHSHTGFVHSLLAGHSLPQWTDVALADYCRRYNIGWVAVWSNPAIQRFRAWKSGASEVCQLKNGKTGYLFKINDNQQTFALHGQADVLQADARRVVLTNVVPRDGKVVLSFHYQSGFCATPSRVKVEKETDALDSIPLLRLRVDSPVSVITITWDHN
jgi:hypothetical protein